MVIYFRVFLSILFFLAMDIVVKHDLERFLMQKEQKLDRITEAVE